MRSKSQTAWEAAAKCATLAQEADDPQKCGSASRVEMAAVGLGCAKTPAVNISEQLHL